MSQKFQMYDPQSWSVAHLCLMLQPGPSGLVFPLFFGLLFLSFPTLRVAVLVVIIHAVLVKRGCQYGLSISQSKFSANHHGDYAYVKINFVCSPSSI